MTSIVWLVRLAQPKLNREAGKEEDLGSFLHS